MLDNIFSSLITNTVSPLSFLLCCAASLLAGLLISLCYMKTGKRYTGSFVTTLAIMPAIVQVVIMMVNGNIGAGVAVAGAFSLVRFRSIPGTAKEIGFIFISLAAGLASGMGYIGYALLFSAVLCLVCLIYKAVGFGEKSSRGKKILTVVVPESLNYTNAFTDIFAEYLSHSELIGVKTTNMGSLFKLRYEIVFKHPDKEKSFIDELRCKNGNLEINCSSEIISQEIL